MMRLPDDTHPELPERPEGTDPAVRELMIGLHRGLSQIAASLACYISATVPARQQPQDRRERPRGRR